MNQAPQMGETVVQFVIAGAGPIPMLTFEHVEFHESGDVYECRFRVAGCEVANIRIPALTIDYVVAAMAEAARAAFAYARPDMPVHDFKMTVERGNGHG